MDPLGKEGRSKLMGRVRQTGTAPELKLRKALREAGTSYRLRLPYKLPGSPDLMFLKDRIAVFVDGCFWHGCPMHGTKSKTNSAFWDAKIARNRERDAQVDQRLREMQWTPLRFWEHEVKTDTDACVRRILATREGSKRE